MVVFRLLRLGPIRRELACVTVVLAALAVASAADDEPQAASRSFDHVRPIFSRHCLECHGASSPEQGLDLSSSASVLRGSETGAVVTASNAAQSLLVQVLSQDADPHMPPERQLAADEVGAISSWINGLSPSTPVGSSVKSAEGRSHWSFRPIERPAIPTTESATWARTPIDRFVLARLEAAELTPNDSADKATLLRRVYLDLIGLPPSPEEATAFLRDDRPNAYERVVDRLLASPRYGERWGRHWLDLARYADSGGFHNDLDRPHAWRYRDYVIASFNRDMPYPQFIKEQLAGDELPDATVETWIATGFCRNGPSNDDNMGKGLKREKYRLDELDDVISTTSNVFLGLTLGCARCHDHKYDPLTQRDYYRFLAFFDSAEKRQLILDSFRNPSPQLKPVTGKPDADTPSAMVLTDYGQEPRTTRLLWRGDVRNSGPTVEPGVPEILQYVSFDSPAEPSQHQPTLWRRLALAKWIAATENPLTWRVMANRLWHYHFGRGLVETPSNFGRLGAAPTHPRLLDWLADELRRSGGRLKSLQRLIVTSSVYRQSSQSNASGQARDSDNRLWWRRDKRRLEAEALRDAILTVAGNLNLEMGGVGVKPRIRPDLLEASQRNKWPVVKREGPRHWRRSVYVYVKRQLQLPMLELFDAPSTAHSCDCRENSLAPTQSLVLMNDDFVREQARHFAARVVRQAGDNPRAQVERALQIALCHPPDDTRIHEGVAFLESQTSRLREEGMGADSQSEALVDFCHVLVNLSEFLYVD